MRARGFTLIELVITMAVSLIFAAAGFVLLAGSQRWFQSGVDDRAMQETARVALEDLVGNVRMAGYGLEPTFVFDTGLLANVPMDRAPAGVQARFGGYNCADGTCRDSIDGPDELLFYARDPTFSRNVAAVGVGSITLATSASLLRGQVLQVMCYGTNNQWLWAYVTVSAVDNTGRIVTLANSPNLDYDFPYQTKLLAQACFQSGTVRAFKVDRYRYYVQSVDDDGNPQPWGTAGAHPYLMLDQGLSQNGAAVQTVIAPDVEDLQVAYVFPLAAAGQQVLAATSGTRVTANITGDDTGFNLNPKGIPTFDTPSLDPLRTTHHPANVRAIRVAITVRSPRQDLKDFQLEHRTIPAALNRPDLPGERGYRRTEFETTVYTHNLESRLPVFPTYDPNFASATNCCPAGGTCAGNCGGG